MLYKHFVLAVVLAILIAIIALSYTAQKSAIQSTIPITTESPGPSITASGTEQTPGQEVTTSTEPITSVEKGANFPTGSDHIQIKYSSFVPVVSRSEAIATARDWLTAGFHIASENASIDSTVGLISGDIELSSTQHKNIGTDVQCWIVVIKGLPSMGSVGPAPDPNHPVKINAVWQANVAIDAITGKLIYAGISGHQQRIPIRLTAFPVQYLLLGQSNSVVLGAGYIVLENGYLRISLDNGNSVLPIWPRGYDVNEENDIITILSGYETVAVHSGDKIEVSGRNVLPGEDIQKLLTYALPEDARGPYWLVGSIREDEPIPPSATNDAQSAQP